ncbi:MAG TPA: phage/plasmid replication protein, II/X family [Bryobacteraceae bacterium]
MIDWLTLRVDACQLAPATLDAFRATQDRITRISPDGSVVWDIPAHETIRSDSHQITVRMGADLSIKGSPARVMGKDNVFGSGDIVACAQAVLAFVSQNRGVTLPDYSCWRVTRVDITHNYDLDNLAAVRQALHELEVTEGGRYQKQTHAGTVYWSPRSAVRSGKVYAKGPHMEHQVRTGKGSFAEDELRLGQNLLRLELSLKSQFWREHAVKNCWQYTEAELNRLHADYFSPLVGTIEVLEVDNIPAKCVTAARQLGQSEGQGMGAYRYWVVIQQMGLERARDVTSRASHYRYLRILKQAGFGYADFQARNVTPLRRKPIILGEPVRSWDELRRRHVA